jgi:molybdopterin-containing oxidoreductase family iron-sulfur binding subunit
MPPLGPGAPLRWRSLDERARTDEARALAAREFLEMLPEEMPVATRRRFLQIAGASLALAGTAGCTNPTWPRWPKEKILPYAYRPDGQMDGIPQHFATSMEMEGVARPLLAKSYDGRPIKIEGNPEHPMSRGGADLWAQASILGPYDPDRSAGPARFANGAEIPASWDEFLAVFGPDLESLRASGGSGLRVLSEPSSSPVLAAARARFLAAFPRALWHEWTPLSRDAAREGARLAFGRPLRTRYRLERADVVVSLDDDFLMEHPAAVAHARAFAARRRAEDGSMLRLYAVESALSVTGSNADVRLPVPSSSVGAVAAALAARLLHAGVDLPAAVAAAVRGADVPEPQRAVLDAMARDLAARRGGGLVAAGAAQPPAVHALAHALNAALGNAGETVDWAAEPDPERAGHVESIRDLADALGSGKVDCLLILGGNPAWDAPADCDVAAALPRAKRSVHLASHRDETSRACTWHLPRAHFLEAWDASLAWDGTWTLAQPLLHPIHGGRTAAETLAWLVDGAEPSGEQLVRSAFHARFGGGEAEWRRAVHDGFVAGSDAPGEVPDLVAWTPRAGDFAAPPGGPIEVVFRGDLKLHDGRFANNAWLQELPDPITKLTWDNAALVAPATAAELGVRPGDVLRITRGARTIELPAYLMPGQAAGSIAVALGWGRRHAGQVADRDSDGQGGGFDAYPARTSDALWSAGDARVEPAGRNYPLASTQGHHMIQGVENAKSIAGQAERMPQLVREATLEHYREHPDFAAHVVHHPPLRSLWEEHSYEQGHRWGMSIDLSSCTGCSACVVACQAENNIPAVGKSEVRRGREMHWIRIDRYFTGDPANPAVAHQPVTCHQCENAPCEQVCPVAATTHSSEGLNDMIYNRCVGTRYCSNNCPYKVRRYNWFNNIADQPAILAMQRNPDVTVRSRGVMEKCTYCVQRIKAVTIPARNEGRPVRDGEIVPACAQTCPTGAIVFGDLNDPESRIRRLHEHPRAYAMLAELNVKPRTRYLAKIRNPGGAPAEPHA